MKENSTGWNNGLSQDYDKKLGTWFADKPGAKHELREQFQQKDTDLTDDEISDVYEKLWPGGPRVLESDIEFAHAILAAQKAKQ